MIRTINYKVDADAKGVTPARQWGGMQFEDKATLICFDVTALDYESYRWRIDLDSPAASYNAGSVTEAVGGLVSRYLEYDMTRYGGNIQVTLVGTKVDSEYNSEQVVYSFPAVIYLTDVNRHELCEGDAARSISAAELSALSAAGRAEASALTVKAMSEEIKEQAVQEAKAFTEEMVGDINSALDGLHTYAEDLISGGAV